MRLRRRSDVRRSCLDRGPARQCHIPLGGRRAEVGSAGDGQTLPLNAVYFLDARHGWAVGELGTILGTTDGGKTWKVQHRGGQRSAVLFIPRAKDAPLELAA